MRQALRVLDHPIVGTIIGLTVVSLIGSMLFAEAEHLWPELWHDAASMFSQ